MVLESLNSEGLIVWNALRLHVEAQVPVEPVLDTDHDIDLLVRAGQIEVLYRQALPGIIISMLVAGLLCHLLWDQTGHPLLIGWLSTVVLVSLFRVLIVLLFAQSNPVGLGILRWERPFIWSVAMVASAWGIGGMLMMPVDSELYQAVIFFFLMGIANGAAQIHAARPKPVAFALVAIMMPATLWLFWQGQTAGVGMAMAGCVYVLAVLRSTRVLAGFLHRSFRLSYELEQAKAAAEQLARTDVLTGLNNRRAFSELGDSILKQCRRRGDPVAMIMIDIDHFKQINDKRSHAAGDVALQHLSRLLLESQRETDICCRLGGEEFVVLLAGAGLEDAR